MAASDHQEGIADDETHAFFTRLMDDSGPMLLGSRDLRDDGRLLASSRSRRRRIVASNARAVKLEANPNYVVSSTRTDFPCANSHQIVGDLRTSVQKLKDANPAGRAHW